MSRGEEIFNAQSPHLMRHIKIPPWRNFPSKGPAEIDQHIRFARKPVYLAKRPSAKNVHETLRILIISGDLSWRSARKFLNLPAIFSGLRVGEYQCGICLLLSVRKPRDRVQTESPRGMPFSFIGSIFFVGHAPGPFSPFPDVVFLDFEGSPTVP